MRFDIVTIFPELFSDFTKQSLIARAIKKKLISIKAYDLRKWTHDRHKTVDDRPYGGGAGMILKTQPIYDAVRFLKNKKLRIKKNKTRVLLLSAKGKQFTQKDAYRLSEYNQLILISGRYEGVDERVADYIADEEISIGPYVVFGGEIPSMLVIEAVSRLVPGVIANEESLKEESFSNNSCSLMREYPQYTRPEVFVLGKKRLPVPSVLLSGNHKEIEKWRKKQMKTSKR